MKIEANDAIAQLVEGYHAALDDDGDFIASEYNKMAEADIFVFDDDTDTLVLNNEALATLPHFRVEWDIDYWGGSSDKRSSNRRRWLQYHKLSCRRGDYHGVGQFVFIPVALTYVFNSVEEVFEKFTGTNRIHIIDWTLDKEFFPDGTIFATK